MKNQLGFKRILVAIDFSPHSEAALRQAVWLARKVGAQITLAHTLPDLRKAVHSVSYQAKVDLLYGEGSVFQREVRQDSDTRMRRMIAILNAVDLDVKVETLVGPLFLTLLILAVLWEINGAPFVWRLLTTAVATFFFFGKFVVLGGSEGDLLDVREFYTAEQLVAMVLYMDVMTASVLAFHLGFLCRLPVAGGKLKALVDDGGPRR